MEPDALGSLIRRAQRGDRSAMNDLLAGIRPYLLRVARSYVDPARASRSVSDLVQEAELRAWRGLDRFGGGAKEEETVAKFRVWMVSIVRRLGLDLRRSRNARKHKAPGYFLVPLEEVEKAERSGGPARDRSQPAREVASPSAALRAHERSDRVLAALGRITDERSREILRLYYFEGLSLRKVSQRLDLPYHEVKERYRAGIQFLERDLKHTRE